MSGFDNEVLAAINYDFRGVQPVVAQVTAAGQLPIGTGASPAIEVGSITSPLSTLSIGYSNPNITLDINSASVGQTITGDSGGALSPTAGNWNILSTATNGIETSGAASTLTVAMSSPYADGDFSFESQSGGAARTLTVQNTVDAASSSARINIAVAGASADDPYQYFSVGSATAYSVGIDNSDSDLFKINTDAAASVSPSSGTNLFNMSPTVGTFVLDSLRNQKTSTGAGINLGVINTATTDADSSARLTAATDSTTADAYLLLDVANVSPGSTSWEIGSNGGNGGALEFRNVVDAGVPALSGTLRMNVSAAGQVTMPTQPRFLARTGAALPQDNVTGAGTVYTMIYNSETYDIGANYNNATGLFTCPVDGFYWFYAAVGMAGLDATATTGIIQILPSAGLGFTGYSGSAGAIRTPSNGLTLSAGGGAFYAAGVTVSVKLTVSGMAGDTVDINVASTFGNYFGGILLA